MSHFLHYRDFVGSSPDKQYKSTLFRSDRLMLGLNCLSPGQEQHMHTHDGQDKFYFVVEGVGDFVVGDERQQAGVGMVVWAPSGITHGVANRSDARLVLMVGIAPLRR